MAKYSDAKTFIHDLNYRYWTTGVGVNTWDNDFTVSWRLEDNRYFVIEVFSGEGRDPGFWGYTFKVPARTGHGRRVLRTLVGIVGSSPTVLSVKLTGDIVSYLKGNATLINRSGLANPDVYNEMFGGDDEE